MPGFTRMRTFAQRVAESLQLALMQDGITNVTIVAADVAAILDQK